MKNLKLSLLLLFAVLMVLVCFCAPPAQAQIGNVTMLFFPGAPSGACSQNQLALNTATAAMFDCNSGVWFQISVSGGGAPTGCTIAAGVLTCTGFAANSSNGGFSGSEGTGASLTCVAGVDCIYMDSTLHDWHVKSNGVDYGENVAASNTLNLTNKTLVAAKVLSPRRWSYDSFFGVGTAFNHSGGDGNVTEAGTASAINGTISEEPMVQWASGAVSTNQAGFASNTASDWFSGRNIYWGAYIKNANADLTNQRFWVGISNTPTPANFNSDTPGTTQKIAMFRFSSVVPDTNYQCVTGNASAQTVTNSNIAADVNSHVFEIQMNDAVPNVVFYIDGVQVCTNSATLPGNNVSMSSLGLITTQTAAAKNIQVGWVSTQSDK